MGKKTTVMISILLIILIGFNVYLYYDYDQKTDHLNDKIINSHKEQNKEINELYNDYLDLKENMTNIEKEIYQLQTFQEILIKSPERIDLSLGLQADDQYKFWTNEYMMIKHPQDQEPMMIHKYYSLRNENIDCIYDYHIEHSSVNHIFNILIIDNKNHDILKDKPVDKKGVYVVDIYNISDSCNLNDFYLSKLGGQD